MGIRDEYEALLVPIADAADKIAMRHFHSPGLRRERKHDGTVVTTADKAIEEMARERVAASGVKLDVYGEEYGGDNRKGVTRLIIDPIDGTEEFSRGIPTFGTLLAIEKDGEIVAGIASAPAMRERWWAYRDEGAYRNGRRIHVSEVSRLSEAMVFTGGTGPSKDREKIEKMRRLADAARHGRAMGGFWQHMLVAEGAVEAALDLRSMPWDLAALVVIVEEAGGKATTLSGERSIYAGHLLSSNGHVHDEILALLR